MPSPERRKRTAQPPSAEDLAPWVGFLTIHSKLVRRLDASLAASHGLTLNEFEVLLKLAIAGGSLRMSDLAQAALLSRSGLTRIVDELEAANLVTRDPDQDDGRVLLATLTRRGRTRLKAARRAHGANVRALFLGPLTPAQRQTLSEAWSAIEQALPQTPDEPEAPRPRRPRRRVRATGLP